MNKLNLIFIFMLLIACGNDDNKDQSGEIHEETNELTITKQQFESQHMQLGHAKDYDFNTIVKVSGMIDVPTHNQSNISTFVGGYVVKNPLLVGDEVKKGEFLVTLENTEYIEIQQQYAELAEELNYLKSEFTRQKTLYDENITSEKNFLKSESAYKSNLAHFNGLKKKLQMMNIDPTSVENGTITSSIHLYSPIDGFVTKVHVSNGTYVSPSDVIMEIIDTDHIHLELSVFERDILKIKKGQNIHFRIPEASDSVYKAEVHLVGTTIDPTNRRVTVHGHIDDDQTGFIVGMFAEAEIIVRQKKGRSLPKTAIIQVENDYFALAVENETSDAFQLKKIKLDLGLQTEDTVEILNHSALKDKEIVINGVYMLLYESEGGGHSH